MSVSIKVFDMVAAGELTPDEGAELLMRKRGRNWIDKLRARLELLALAFGLGAIVSCSAIVVPNPVPAPEPSPPGSCEVAEANLERLQCVQKATSGEPVQLWVGFADACESSELDGQDWNAQHIACAETCNQATDAWLGKWTCPDS